MANASGSLCLTIFDGRQQPRLLPLNPTGKPCLVFGRSPGCDIPLNSPLASAEHGRVIFQNGQWIIQDKAAYQSAGSTNGLILGASLLKSHVLRPGDAVRIDSARNPGPDGVLFLVTDAAQTHWTSLRLDGQNEVTLGRDPSCTVTLSNPSISHCHAKLQRTANGHILQDCGSTNGILVNGQPISGPRPLREKDVLTLPGFQLVYTAAMLCCCGRGAAAAASQSASAPVRQPSQPVSTPADPIPLSHSGQTTFYQEPQTPQDGGQGLLVTIFDGMKAPRTLRLDTFGKGLLTFGRDPSCDIPLSSPLVSHEHGHFRFQGPQWVMEDKAIYTGHGSTNGLIYAGGKISSRVLCEGDVIRIDNGREAVSEGVLFVFSYAESNNRWSSVRLEGRNEITIGRDSASTITLPHVSVSKHHARLLRAADGWYIEDTGSTNGVIVNGAHLSGRQKLHEKDVIGITNSKLIFTSAAVSYCCYRSGISVDAANVVITRGKGRKKFVTGNNVSMNIRPGELVAIIGGSGAGKSTILNAMCGYLPPAQGSVFINGVNLYQNFDALKQLIGYVPQQDIVYDNLTLYDMLAYTAKLRLPRDTTFQEREAAIDRAIALVELTEKKRSYIKALSGGQRKRASIAVELLSDPNLLFLDEPASGLDPGTERNLMCSLREMADNGKTVILVTHSTLQLKLCDKIVFMGKGGNLCYFGSYDEALEFFGVDDVVDVYNMITDNAKHWRTKYDQSVMPSGISRGQGPSTGGNRGKKGPQLPVLCARYMKLVVNDRQRLLLLMVQAPLLAMLISLVADDQQFIQYEMTKSLLFALSCSAFWVGMLNAIQEVCKERNILKREYMTGLSLTGYITSKILVLSILCLIQSAMIVCVFALMVGLPDEGLMLLPLLELLITTFLTAVASAAMGLFVSCLFTNADRAMTVAPILLMPQILFSGLIFKLDGATEAISWFAVCRWSMEGYGTTANLNSLEMRLQQQGIPIEHEAEAFFEFTNAHLFTAWGILAAFILALLIMARIALINISKEKG